jgi:hypothetical protein
MPCPVALPSVRTPQLRQPRVLLPLAAAGSVAMAVSSWWTAALPAGHSDVTAAYVPFYLGLAAVLITWLALAPRSPAHTAPVRRLGRPPPARRRPVRP